MNAPDLLRRRLALLPLAALLIAGLSGCVSDADTDAAGSGWTAPAWMAEHAAAQEQAEALLDSCLAAKGWNVARTESGGFGPFDDTFPQEQFAADSDQCTADLGFDPERLMSQEEIYQRHGFMVDMHSCLIAHGVEMELTPTSADVWVEEYQAWQNGEGDHPWHPHFDPGMMMLPWGELLEVNRACPQPFVP